MVFNKDKICMFSVSVEFWKFTICKMFFPNLQENKQEMERMEKWLKMLKKWDKYYSHGRPSEKVVSFGKFKILQISALKIL